MKRFALGFRTYFQGIKFWLKTPALLKISAIPLCIDAFLFAAGIAYSFSKIPMAVGAIVHEPNRWYQYLLYYLMVILTALTFFILTLFATSIIANFVAFPFNDRLSERALILKGALPQSEKKIKAWFAQSLKNAGAMAKKATILLVAAGLLIFAALIPGLGVIGLIIGVFLMAWDVVDFNFDHFAMTFAQRKKFIRTHLFEISGFAVGLGLTMSIPVLNMFIMPGSIVAGSCLVAEIRKRESSIERPHSQTPR